LFNVIAAMLLHPAGGVIVQTPVELVMTTATSKSPVTVAKGQALFMVAVPV
jgi:hypothetical protein